MDLKMGMHMDRENPAHHGQQHNGIGSDLSSVRGPPRCRDRKFMLLPDWTPRFSPMDNAL